jgi:hypothetical protein
MDPDAYRPGLTPPLIGTIERRRYIRAATSRDDVDAYEEIVLPLMRDICQIIDEGGTEKEVNDIFVHAVHDGVSPLHLVRAYAQVQGESGG